MKSINKINIFNDYFKDSKVLITGHNGFKGTWLSKILTMNGAKVYGFSKKNNNPHFAKLNFNNQLYNKEGDVTNFKQIKNFIKNTQPDFVFHLAAQALVSTSLINPLETIQTNVIGLANFLESLRDIKSIRSAVIITSDKCYDNQEWIWGYREEDKLGGKDPYSASKASAEIIFNSYLKSFFNETKLGLASARAGNVIGGGDWSKDRLIPDCVKSINSNNQILIRSPKSNRPWQHVLEPLSGYLTLAKKLSLNKKKFLGSYNFGPDNKSIKNVEEIVKLIISKYGKGRYKIKKNPLSLKESKLLQLNCDKSKNVLNWYPKWDIYKTIEETIYWYKNYHNNYNSDVLTSNQINKYFNES